MNLVFISIGSNMGHRLENCNKAIAFLRTLGKLNKLSTIYETEAWGYDDEKYLNMVIILKTKLQAVELLNKLLSFEESIGRKRGGLGYEARIIDLDILFYNDLILKTEILEVPHPKILERQFILKPLAEIAPDFTHPENSKKVSRLLKICTDTLSVNPFACAL